MTKATSTLKVFMAFSRTAARSASSSAGGAWRTRARISAVIPYSTLDPLSPGLLVPDLPERAQLDVDRDRRLHAVVLEGHWKLDRDLIVEPPGLPERLLDLVLVGGQHQ